MLLKRIVLFSLFLLSINTFCFGQATWIGYPGDYDIWLGNNVNNQRTERGAFFPPFWKMDSHYVLVEFSKEFDLKSPEEIHIYVEGRYNVKLDGKLQNGTPSKMMLPAGKHALNIKVHNQACVPAIYVEGKTVFTDSSWKVTFEDKEWIDESGKASDKSATVYMNAAALNFNSPEQRPSLFKLNQVPMSPLSITKTGKGTLVDFGKETFGYVTFHQLCGKGEVCIYYGESRDEALSVDSCETLDKIQVNNDNPEDLTLTDSKAYRYVYIENDDGVRFESISMRYEYVPLDYRGSFRCSDEEINRIWDVAAYTLHLTTRKVFLDGIKRDRWAWSGDAIQSYLMNYYLFFDPNTVTRTINLLRGKDPVTSHINTIMDYTFYWFMSIYDYYLYTGDLHFIRQIYPKMVSLMDFVLGRTNAEGMVEGLSGDWVFVDWADGFMDKRGELSFEQLLFCKSLQTMALCASIAGNQTDKEKYTTLGDRLFSKLETYFWDDRKQAFVHNRKEGIKSEQVTRYANIFAILFDYVDNEKKQGIKKNVLLNDSIMKITTPYMRFMSWPRFVLLANSLMLPKKSKPIGAGC